VRGSKEMLLYARDHSVAEGLNYVATWNAGMLSKMDLETGITAQFEKKQAAYEN
jgi:enoyl-CoA hydratase